MEKVLIILLALAYCTMATETETCDKCVLVPVKDSQNYISFTDETRGHCTNKQPIPDLQKCFGYCPNKPLYHTEQDLLIADCKLCAPYESVAREIELDCDDNSKLKFTYLIPVKCLCKDCMYKDPYPSGQQTAQPN